MPTIYQTRDGDVLDAICAAHYGSNLADTIIRGSGGKSGLADRGAVYPSGLSVILPERVIPVVESAFSLWD